MHKLDSAAYSSGIAQWLEHLARDRKTMGSIPSHAELPLPERVPSVSSSYRSSKLRGLLNRIAKYQSKKNLVLWVSFIVGQSGRENRISMLCNAPAHPLIDYNSCF